jgi:hypothetical protein
MSYPIKTTLIALFTTFVVSGHAQEEEKKYVKKTFTHSQLINCQTVEMVSKKGYEFRIQHRFGAVTLDEKLVEDFLGMDLPSNIRFYFNYPISDRFYVGLGRTKVGKTYDLEGKYLLLRQTKDNKMPVSVAAYFNAGMSTTKFQDVASNLFFADSITPFENKFAHRMAYNTQLIIARKFSNKFSMQVTPTFIYRNLVAAGDDNHNFVLPASLRLKLGLSFSILAEYAYVFNNRTDEFKDPVSVGIEIGTVGHTFQFMVSSSGNMLEQNMYSATSYDITERIVLGFNIKRTFFRKKDKE